MKVKVEGLDENFNPVTIEAEGLLAVVLCHEIDHLDGILHMDVAKEVLVMSKEERKEFRKDHPYKVISKTCEYD